MSNEPAQDRLTFKVVCTWCGAVIRLDTAKESRGMCLRCYARMLSEHGRAGQHGDKPRYASER
jgi:ribosomal protein L40E